jgi:hypothetical protein
MVRVRYGAGGVEYIEKDPIEKEQEELEASLKQSKAAKAERVGKKKKKKVIQEIMGDDLKESKEMLDEII